MGQVLGNLAPPRSMLEEEGDNHDVFLVRELLLRPRPQLECIPVVALLVGAPRELRGNPEPSFAAHLFDAGEEFFILLLGPRLGVHRLRLSLPTA